MDFLFKDRGSGKRAIKPSKEAEILEAMIPDRDSDDSDFELDKHSSGGGDSDDDRSSSDNDNSDNEGSSSESEEESVDEDELLKLKSNLTTSELVSLARSQTGAVSASGGTGGSVKVQVCRAVLW